MLQLPTQTSRAFVAMNISAHHIDKQEMIIFILQIMHLRMLLLLFLLGLWFLRLMTALIPASDAYSALSALKRPGVNYLSK